LKEGEKRKRKRKYLLNSQLVTLQHLCNRSGNFSVNVAFVKVAPVRERVEHENQHVSCHSLFIIALKKARKRRKKKVEKWKNGSKGQGNTCRLQSTHRGIGQGDKKRWPTAHL
jgi:hypothetical protein